MQPDAESSVSRVRLLILVCEPLTHAPIVEQGDGLIEGRSGHRRNRESGLTELEHNDRAEYREEGWARTSQTIRGRPGEGSFPAGDESAIYEKCYGFTHHLGRPQS